MKKKLLSLLLALSICIGLALPVFAYSDVSGADLSEAVAVLSGLGIVSGYTDGTYRPGEALTRAQFCKLAVLAEGHGGAVAASAYKTLFSDVPAGGWAAPYVNLAYEEKLVSGYGNGTFGPDDAVTTAQAVTIVLKLLGYSTADIGPFWPEDYMSKAQSLGLLDSIAKTADDRMTRGDAALLLYNLLNTSTVQGKAFYLNLCATVQSGVLLMETDATADDGTLHTVKTYANGAVSYVARTAELPVSLAGQRGTLLLDQSGKVCGFLPDGGVTKTLTLSAATATALAGEDGASLTVSASVGVLLDDERQTYEDCWYNLIKGDQVTVYYTEAGGIDLVWVSAPAAGAESTVTGYYEDAAPNTAAPSTVTVLGASLSVTDEGRAALAAFSIGDKLTLTLDRSGKVCGAAAASAAASQYGVLKSADSERAEVALLSGVTAVGATDTELSSSLVGGLVRVSAAAMGKLSVSALSASGSAGALDTAAGTVGDRTLADNVRVFERVDGCNAVEISLDDITAGVLPASAVTYVGVNAGGQADLLVLGNATGACYAYGILSVEVRTTGTGTQTATNHTVSVENSGGTGTAFITGEALTDGAVGGVAGTVSGRAASVVALTAVEDITRADFDGTDSVAGIPIADGVQVYNTATGKWTTLSAAKAFTDSFTVYYDETPGAYKQIRVIFAQ